MRILAVPVLLLAALVVPLAEAQVYTPPVTSRCFSQLDHPIQDGGATVCLDWGGEGCAVLVSREHVWGRETTCVLAWPPLP